MASNPTPDLDAQVKQLREKLQKSTKLYEGKLAALTAIKDALQKENDQLREAGHGAGTNDDREAREILEEEMEELKEEFQKRLGASDRTIETLKDEKAKLQQALNQVNAGSSASEAQITEMADTIESLRQEGEALSRKSGDLETSLRKLRATNRDVEAERDKLQLRVKALEGQLLELQERSEREAQQAAAQIDLLERDMRDLRIDVKKQVSEAKKEAQDALFKLESEAAKGSEALLAASQEREATLALSLQELRSAMGDLADEAADKEDSLRRQALRLEERIRQLEAEKEGVLNSASETSRPLLKQIESMATAAAASAAAAEQAEVVLTAQLRDAEMRLAEAREAERAALSRLAVAEASAGAAKEAAGVAVESGAETRARLETERRKSATLEAERAAAEERLAAALEREKRLREDADAAARELQERLWDAEQRARTAVIERDELMKRHEEAMKRAAEASSGMNLLGEMDILASSAKDEGLMNRRQPSPIGAGERHDGVISVEADPPRHRGSEESCSDATMEPQIDDGDLESLLASLSRRADSEARAAKIKSSSASTGIGLFGMLTGGSNGLGGRSPGDEIDAGKVQRTLEALRQRLRSAERARDDAAEQLCLAIQRADQIAADAKSAVQIRQQLIEMSRRVDVALELLGERNERVEQLEGDISEMKMIFQHSLEAAVASRSNGIV